MYMCLYVFTWIISLCHISNIMEARYKTVPYLLCIYIVIRLKTDTNGSLCSERQLQKKKTQILSCRFESESLTFGSYESIHSLKGNNKIRVLGK